jgi:hypothetical protein
VVDGGVGRIRRSVLCARMSRRGVRPVWLARLARADRTGGSCLHIRYCSQESKKKTAYSATLPAVLTSPTISTTNTTASAPLTFFLNSSFNLGCPGRSTSVRDLVASPSVSVRGKVVEEGEMEVCV